MAVRGLTAAHACFCMQLGCEVGVSLLKELTRTASRSSEALAAASEAARSGDMAAARTIWLP